MGLIHANGSNKLHRNDELISPTFGHPIVLTTQYKYIEQLHWKIVATETCTLYSQAILRTSKVSR